MRKFCFFSVILGIFLAISACGTKSKNEVNGNQSKDTTLKGETVTSEIPFVKEDGVCKVKCKINDLPLHFVFDTGASDVTLSMVEATFMMKNG